MGPRGWPGRAFVIFTSFFRLYLVLVSVILLSRCGGGSIKGEVGSRTHMPDDSPESQKVHSINFPFSFSILLLPIFQMSSLRNAIQRRNHRERDQPAERKKWGLLEKRKDYKLRAADHKTKQKKIKALQQKASERNEDEFYFSMVNNTTKGGIKVAKRGESNSGGATGSLDLDVVKLMKTQDVGYLRTVLQSTRREMERVREEAVVAQRGVNVQPARGDGKVIFDEDGEVVQQDARGDRNEGMDDLADLDGLDGSFGSEDGSDGEDEDLSPAEIAVRRRKRHALQVKQKKLEVLREQEDKLDSALQQVEHQRAKMNGTVGGANKNGVKFKTRQRKR